VPGRSARRSTIGPVLIWINYPMVEIIDFRKAKAAPRPTKNVGKEGGFDPLKTSNRKLA
jgi:hypothetical protein